MFFYKGRKRQETIRNLFTQQLSFISRFWIPLFHPPSVKELWQRSSVAKLIGFPWSLINVFSPQDSSGSCQEPLRAASLLQTFLSSGEIIRMWLKGGVYTSGGCEQNCKADEVCLRLPHLPFPKPHPCPGVPQQVFQRPSVSGSVSLTTLPDPPAGE